MAIAISKRKIMNMNIYVYTYACIVGLRRDPSPYVDCIYRICIHTYVYIYIWVYTYKYVFTYIYKVGSRAQPWPYMSIHTVLYI